MTLLFVDGNRRRESLSSGGTELVNRGLLRAQDCTNYEKYISSAVFDE